MWVVFLILIIIICVGIFLIIKITKHNKDMNSFKSKKENSIIANLKNNKMFSFILSKKESTDPIVNSKPENKPVLPEKKEENSIEVLEVYPSSGGKMHDVNGDMLDLDELFKTISMTAINNDSDFDFGLRRSDKK